MLQAIILDFNGVVISDEEYHKESWRRFTKQLGHDLSEQELKENVFGHRETDIFKFLLKRDVAEEEVEKLSQQRNEIVYQLEGEFIPVPGVLSFVKSVEKSKIKLGLATNSRRSYMQKVLEAFKISHIFDTIVTAEDVSVGKPDPQIYTKTAKQLDTKTENCLVFEDSPPGIESAKSAGMRVIALTTTYSTTENLKKADKLISNFTEITLEDCQQLMH